MVVAVERPVRVPRSDVRVLVGTGAAVGTGCALLLPIVWMVVWGAFAGLVSASLWQRRHRWGRSRSLASAVSATAAVVGISAGLALGLLVGDPLSGAVVGLVAASGAGLTAGSCLRRLARREAPVR